MNRWVRITLWIVWLTWVFVCLGSFALEVESPLYTDGISWVYWGAETDLGWRNSSLLRWGLYHGVLIMVPVVAFRLLRRMSRRARGSSPADGAGSV